MCTDSARMRILSILAASSSSRISIFSFCFSTFSRFATKALPRCSPPTDARRARAWLGVSSWPATCAIAFALMRFLAGSCSAPFLPSFLPKDCAFLSSLASLAVFFLISFSSFLASFSFFFLSSTVTSVTSAPMLMIAARSRCSPG